RNNYSSETISGYKKDLDFFNSYMTTEKKASNFKIEQIEKKDLLDFMDFGREQGHKTNSVARRISTLKSFYKFLVYELDFPFDVTGSIRVPKAYIPLPHILSETEVKELLSKAKELSYLYGLLFSTIYYTGS